MRAAWVAAVVIVYAVASWRAAKRAFWAGILRSLVRLVDRRT